MTTIITGSTGTLQGIYTSTFAIWCGWQWQQQRDITSTTNSKLYGRRQILVAGHYRMT